MSKVTVIAKLKAKPGLEEKVRQELEVMVKETEKEPGCINYDLHRHMEEPGTFLFHENWESKEALDRHMKTEHFLRLSGIAADILAEEPEISLFEQIRQSKCQPVH
ncbi:MAG TPA: putative quinol monooxygenase [Candidatus Melainabacteria bacterium]|nr:putative quinol monooxygenase [Candidatus Melainabacteria bacterium]HMP52498.1 putative quinol monooxygenase [Candidatus Melainabacteria bacterium]